MEITRMVVHRKYVKKGMIASILFSPIHTFHRGHRELYPRTCILLTFIVLATGQSPSALVGAVKHILDVGGFGRGMNNGAPVWSPGGLPGNWLGAVGTYRCAGRHFGNAITCIANIILANTALVDVKDVRILVGYVDMQ